MPCSSLHMKPLGENKLSTREFSPYGTFDHASSCRRYWSRIVIFGFTTDIVIVELATVARGRG